MASRTRGKSYAAAVKGTSEITCKGDLLIQQLAEAMASEIPVAGLPVAGLFCPRCCHGLACAFHAPSTQQASPCSDSMSCRSNNELREDWKWIPEKGHLRGSRQYARGNRNYRDQRFCMQAFVLELTAWTLHCTMTRRHEDILADLPILLWIMRVGTAFVMMKRIWSAFIHHVNLLWWVLQGIVAVISDSTTAFSFALAT